MVTVQECARCLGLLFETKSVTQTHRNYHTRFTKQPPSDKAIGVWQWRFLETGSLYDPKRSGKPGINDECVERICESFVRSPTKSTHRALRELLLPRSTIHKVLLKRLSLCAYKDQIVQQLKPCDGCCAPQFFKTLKGLCGHTVLRSVWKLIGHIVLIQYRTASHLQFAGTVLTSCCVFISNDSYILSF
jgi:hypothetical protein